MVSQQVARERLLYVLIICLLCALSLYLAYLLRYDFNLTRGFFAEFVEVLLWMLPLKMVILYSFGQFDALFIRLRTQDFYRLAGALGVHAAFLFYLWQVFEGNEDAAQDNEVPSRGIILIDFMLSVMLIGTFRGLVQTIRGDALGISETGSSSVSNVAIIGAGFVGSALARDLQLKRGYGKRPLIFLDDDPSKIGHNIHGLRVVGDIRSLKTQIVRYDIDLVVLAMPAAPQMLIRFLVSQSLELGFDLQIVPSPQEMLNGQIRPYQLRPVKVDDLLGRDVLESDELAIHELIHAKTVMVTGAGGSVGSELCRQIAAHGPSRLILIDQSEVQLFAISHELETDGHGVSLLSLVADIGDHERMEYIFDHFRPDIIYHAAAHKHVPLMESQPSEALNNNSLATANLARLASRYNVESFTLISTDKAIRPTSVMGTSKRLAEIAIQQVQKLEGNTTRFMAVRFGNVLGSSGSVIPIFKRQIEHGGPITVTHPEMTRYFMTIHEAVGLVLQSSTMGAGGEIFILDMGKPIKIVEIAHLMIELHGLQPDTDIEVKFIGLRPGEKLFEELQHQDEDSEKTRHPQVYCMRMRPELNAKIDQVYDFLTSVTDDVNRLERNKIKQMLREFVPEYTPYMD
ncbi:MAG: polysaccharide biosynthesis protein [Opitutales bacterium]